MPKSFLSFNLSFLDASRKCNPRDHIHSTYIYRSIISLACQWHEAGNDIHHIIWDKGGCVYVYGEHYCEARQGGDEALDHALGSYSMMDGVEETRCGNRVLVSGGMQRAKSGGSGGG